jgi:hypothetical protein
MGLRRGAGTTLCVLSRHTGQREAEYAGPDHVGYFVCRAKARPSSGRKSHPATFVPPRSNRSSRGVTKRLRELIPRRFLKIVGDTFGDALFRNRGPFSAWQCRRQYQFNISFTNGLCRGMQFGATLSKCGKLDLKSAWSKNSGRVRPKMEKVVGSALHLRSLYWITTALYGLRCHPLMFAIGPTIPRESGAMRRGGIFVVPVLVHAAFGLCRFSMRHDAKIGQPVCAVNNRSIRQSATLCDNTQNV